MIRTIGILMAVCLSAVSAHPAAVLEVDVARQVLAEINLARTEPLKYAGFLREIRGYFKGKDYHVPGTDSQKETYEGVAAVDEAIRFLSRQKSMPPLVWSAGLSVAAAELVMEQGKSGATGHNGAQSGGMLARIERHGMWKGRIGEAIAYGPNDARMIVMQLIIDDGISDRAHRNNLFNQDFGSSGVACGPHPDFGSVCVIDFATRFRERAR
jgi:uncharacterized protein YkwD